MRSLNGGGYFLSGMNISTSFAVGTVKHQQNYSRVDTVTIPFSCLFYLHSLLLSNDRQSTGLYKEAAMMRNEKLKSTTVRFTESDLHVIARLQDKLGLGMIQVIRLAIRRLAEIENVVASQPPRKKG